MFVHVLHGDKDMLVISDVLQEVPAMRIDLSASSFHKVGWRCPLGVARIRVLISVWLCKVAHKHSPVELGVDGELA